MYPSTSLFIAVGQLAIVVLVLFSYPLQVHPCRNCLDKVFSAGDYASPGVAKPVSAAEDDQDADADVVDDDHASHDMSPLKHMLLSAAIIGCGFAIAFFVDDLQLGNFLSFLCITAFVQL